MSGMEPREAVESARPGRARLMMVVGLAVAAFTLIVVLANVLALRHPRRIQLAPDSRFELSPLTVQFLRTLTNEVEVTVFYDRDEVLYSAVTGLLREYAEVNPRVRVRHVDHARHPEEAILVKARHRITDPVNKDMVIFESGGRVRLVYQGEMSEYELESMREDGRADVKRTGFKGELLFTSALLAVSEARSTRGYVLRGHGEHSMEETGEMGYSKFAGVMRAMNVELEPLVLQGTNEVPADCELLVVAGPRVGLMRVELERLDRYLERGGRMFLALNYFTVTNRLGLDGLLRKWGVEAGGNVVLDRQNAVGDGGVLGVEFGDHAITRPLAASGTPVALVLPRTVQRVETRSADAARVTEIIYSGESSVTTSEFLNGIPQVDARDRRGRASLMVAVEKGGIEGLRSDAGRTRVVVAGDSGFLANGGIGIDMLGNRDLGRNVVSWLTDRSVLLSGLGPRPLHQYELRMTRASLTRARWILLGGVPGGILMVGGVVWLRRRR